MDSIDAWIHPTGKTPKTVNLLCLGPSRQRYLDACFTDEPDEIINTADEVWTLNRGGLAFPHDLLFVMDHIGGEADKFPRYGAALWNHSKPIITSDNCEGWPAHVRRYPMLELWDWLRRNVQPNHGDWFHNSVAYILVYAAFIGVKTLRVFGADYHNHTSGVVEDGHPCVAYWAGRLESAGLVVMPVAESGFLNANQRQWMYGYKDDPRRIPAARARFRAMVGLEAAPESTTLRSGERQVGTTLEEIQPDHRYRYDWANERVFGNVLDLGAGIGYGSALLADNPVVTAVTSVERSAESRAYARAHYARDKIGQAGLDLDFPINWTDDFDWAVAFEIIEHLAHPKRLLKDLPAKRLLLSVPNETVVPYSPETAPFHQRHYTQTQLQELLSDSGWRVIAWYGQSGPMSPVMELNANSRTLIVECERYGTMD